MARWHIEGFEGGDRTFDAWLSGRFSERQVAQILARLQSRHLTDREVVAFAKNSHDRDRLSELVQSSRGGLMTVVGGSDHYTARFENPGPESQDGGSLDV
jgi:anthranilate phosphoribosyltransferase